MVNLRLGSYAGRFDAYSVLLSLITTVRNEERSIAHLIDSVIAQEGPIELIVIDSASEDRTREIVRMYMQDHDWIKLLLEPGTRSYSRRKGIEAATGEWLWE